MSETDIFNNFVDFSVKFNGIYVPGGALQKTLGYYCKCVCVWTHNKDFEVRLVGTSIPLLYKGRYFLICSAHQIRDVDPKDVCLITPDSQNWVSSSGARFYKQEKRQESDAFDVAALEFTDSVAAHESLRAEFLDFRTLPSDIRNDYIIAFLVSGYPSSAQLYDLFENNHIGFKGVGITALPQSQSIDDSLIKARYVEFLDFDPDGLSGSPVFVVQYEYGELRAYLAGMVLRSNREEFHFLKVGYIKSFIDSFVPKVQGG